MRTVVAVIAAILGLLASTGTALAADFNVTTTADHEDKFCDADCTLREAVDLAGSADTINVPAGTYTLSATLGELMLVGDHIVGAGARTTIIQAQKTRVLRAADGSSTIAGVTIQNGNGVSSVSTGFGGGVFVGSGASIALTNSTIRNNTASGAAPGGGGIAGPGNVTLIGSTVSGNQVGTGRISRGGGIFVTGTLAIGNTTVSGNTVAGTGTASQGGGIFAAGPLNSINVTIAGNTAGQGGGIYVETPPAGATQQFANTIVGPNTGGSCAGPGLTTDTSRNSLGRDGTCQFAGAGDIQDADPLLGALANNGGATDTHALPPNSPAVDKGATCPTTDQRGFTRAGNGSACDIGAYEYRPPKLTVTTAVINDSGGTLAPGGVSVHVLVGKTDVAGSPQPGSGTGTVYTLVAGTTYTVTANAVTGYTRTVGIDCAANGTITLQEGQNRTCQVTENDVAPTLKVTTAVINDNGGSLTAAGVLGHVRLNGADVFNSPQAGSAAGAHYMLSAGTFNVAPDSVTGYTFALGGACAANGNVTLAVGDAKTCTITANDVAPKLTVTTVVVNGANGNATPGQFSVHVRSGTTEVSGSPQPGSANGTQYTLSAGAYGVSADGVPGYSVTGSDACAANGAVTLHVGDDVTCTVTAVAGAPTLRIVMHVLNDDGGTRPASGFTARVRGGGIDVTGSPQLGSETGTAYSIGIGDYTVSADAVPGYTLATSGACAATGAVTLGTGDDKTCTITANDVAPTLKVITTVVNDNGGTQAPSGFTVHVRKSGADVSGSPKAGSPSGSSYTLQAGTYTVGSDAVTGYTAAIGGACAANGAVTMAVGETKTCTVTGNDNAVSGSKKLPPPRRGKNVNALPATGTVKIKLPGSKTFVVLDEGEQIPLGTVIDVRKGRVTLIASPDEKESADFYGGIFKLGQTKGSKPITVVTLVQKLTGCKAKGKASIARKKTKKRRLWGDGKGNFRTKGKHSAATVVGTKWLVEDRCTSTLTRVARGKVKVQDFVKHKTVLVKAGKKYVARAR